MRWWGLVLLSVTPLQWFVVTQGPFGVVRIHQAAMFAFIVLIAVRFRLAAYSPVVRQTWQFVVANTYLFGTTLLVQLVSGGRPAAAIKEAIYLLVFLAFGTYVYRAGVDLIEGSVELLRWSALAAAAVLLLAMSFSMVSNGVNPVSVVQQAIATANPELIQKRIFKASFAGYGYDAETVLGNMRHEIFGALLVAMYVASWAVRMKPLTGRGARVVWRVAMIVSVVLLAISLSRSVLLAAAVWPLVSLLRYVRTFTLTRRQMIMVGASLVGAAAIVLSGVGSVLYARFTADTSSYSARGGLYADAIEGIRENFLFGGVSTAGASSHNFVVDSWLRGGVFPALAAAAVLAILVMIWIRVLVDLVHDPAWMQPVAAAFALPIDRMLTAGGGAIPPVEWLALGFIGGALAIRARLGRVSNVERDSGLMLGR